MRSRPARKVAPDTMQHLDPPSHLEASHGH